MKPKFKNFLFTFIKGGAIGIANLIPGVSGGTVAVVVGIYDKLIESISNLINFKKVKKSDFVFLLTLITGAMVFIVLSTGLISYLINNYFGILMFCFLGIILGSFPRIIKMHENMKITFRRIIIFIFGILIPVLITFLTQDGCFVVKGLESDIHNYFMLLVTGILAGGTMLVPGISGALVLVLLGQYVNVIYYLRQVIFKPLIFFTIGVIAGVFIFAKLINMFLNRYPSMTLYFILGLILGTSYKIYPGFPVDIKTMILSGMFFVICFCISFILGSFKFQKGGKVSHV